MNLASEFLLCVAALAFLHALWAVWLALLAFSGEDRLTLLEYVALDVAMCLVAIYAACVCR